ncbi:methylamine utilization protein [Balneatrix alpica]|uniref:methylamine utilization protein n=1 Tax=Balneatrix alpica TaxID=75684 RepID=UPI002739BA57|nr:methylamine utilization protein [Balneatrix alpica]
MRTLTCYAFIATSLALTLPLTSSLSLAASLQLQLTDQQGQPLANAVVEVIAPAATDVPPQQAQVRQHQRQFIPHVSAVPVGSAVSFPNDDHYRHHVYSFSEAKMFELQLYQDERDHAPVIFDRPGLVMLGCNIHDSMLAYIYVGQSPWLGVSDQQGQVNLSDLPPGPYQVKLWHPWQLQSQTQPLSAGQHQLSLTVKPPTPDKPMPKYYDPLSDY